MGRRDFLKEEVIWDIRPVFEIPEELTCILIPYFTAKQILLREKETESLEQKQGGEEEINWQTVMLSTLSEESFVFFVKGLTRRALYAASQGEEHVTLEQLYVLMETLDEVRKTAFQIEVLEKFMETAFAVMLCTPVKEAWEGQMEQGAVIPMFPQFVLSWYTREGEELVLSKVTDLRSHFPLSQKQIEEIRTYFEHFQAESAMEKFREEHGNLTLGKSWQEEDVKGACTIIFEDYCFMLTRQCVKDIIYKMEEEAGTTSLENLKEICNKEYSVIQLAEELEFERYRSMGNRFLLNGARIPVSMDTEEGTRITLSPLYELMGVMFPSLSVEKCIWPETLPVHRLVVEKNKDSIGNEIYFGSVGFQEKQLQVIKRAESTEELLLLDIFKEEMIYPDKELAVSFVRKPTQLPSVRQEKIPLPLTAGRKLYIKAEKQEEESKTELWKLPISMTEVGEQIQLGFGNKGNLTDRILNTVDFTLGVVLPFEIARVENSVHCVWIKKVPEKTLYLLQEVKKYDWEQVMLLFPSPTQDNHGTDPVTDSKRNQALSLLRCNLSERTKPMEKRKRKKRG